MHKFAVFAIFAVFACGVKAQSNMMDYMVMQSMLGNNNNQGSGASPAARGNPTAADVNPFDALLGLTASGNPMAPITGGVDPMAAFYGGNPSSALSGGNAMGAIAGGRRRSGNARNNRDFFSRMFSSPMGLLAANNGAMDNMFEMYACGQMNMPLNSCLTASLLL